MNLIGTYECKTDSKGRFMMPASLKKQLKSVVNEGFVLKRSVFKISSNIKKLSMPRTQHDRLVVD